VLDLRSIRMFVVRGARIIKQTKHFRLKKVYCFLEFLSFFVSTCEMNVQGDQCDEKHKGFVELVCHLHL
jgi:hypothetical protein